MGRRSFLSKAAWALAVAALVLTAAGTPVVSPASDEKALALRDAIDRQIHLDAGKLLDSPGGRTPRGRIQPKLVQLYHSRDMEPFWVSPAGPNVNAAVLRAVLSEADSHGLDPEDYAVGTVDKYWASRDVPTLARLELLLTLALGDYVSDLAEGRRKPREFDPKLFPTACDCDLDAPALVTRSMAAADLRSFLEDQAPPFQQYRDLRAKLAEYRAFAAGGGWPLVPDGSSLKPGVHDVRVAAVRRRLDVTDGPALGGPDTRTVYDAGLLEVVKKFQGRHGLEPDGVIGRGTIAAMNVPADDRVRQIIVNMEGWRWVSPTAGDRMLVVNIPAFELDVLRDGRTDLSMAVIVGEEYHMTPVFSDRMRYVEVNPYWDVPQSIAAKEMLPKLREDPQYLKKLRIRIYRGDPNKPEIDPSAVAWDKVSPEDMDRYWLRQDPGPENSLGTLAFMFPNEFNVYLHDTPAKSLFDREKRAFSHGCIRVAKAMDLALYVLGGRDDGWDEKRIEAMIATGANRIVHLDPPLPIYILYNTAVVDPGSHEIRFFNDIYGRDALLERAIF